VEPIEILRANRRAKLDELRRRGIDPFPARCAVDGRVSELVARFGTLDATALESAPVHVRAAGRVTAIRLHGSISATSGAPRATSSEPRPAS
jgi:lysyl-tRNA synthetase class II